MDYRQRHSPGHGLKKAAYQAGVLFLLVGLLAACNRGGPAKPLFPETKPWDLKSLQITGQDNEELFFKRKNCVWTVGREGLAANEVKVSELAEQIMGLSYRQAIPDSENLYAGYRVAQDSFYYRVTIGLPGGETTTLFLGSKSGSAVSHARLAGDKRIFQLAGKTAVERIPMTANAWLPVPDA